MSESPHSILPISLEMLRIECERLEVELLGVAPLTDDEGSLLPWLNPHIDRVVKWVDEDKHAQMEWMVDQLEKRVDPRRLHEGVRTGVVLWISHHFDDELKKDPPEVTGRVARYAWGRDYHNVLRRILRQLGKWLKTHNPDFSFHGSVDTSPVLERAIAERCGVGWIGRSMMLIHPRRGTFGSIAVLLSTATFSEAGETHPFRCGTCTSCLEACPTGALSEEGLDANLCISYWTIEHRGLIPRWFRPYIGDWVFGCDLCQDICPWTRRASKSPLTNDALWKPNPEHASPDLLTWLKWSDEALNEALKGSPLRRAHPRGLKRNALIVIANTKKIDALEDVLIHLTHEDEGVRGTAAWTIAELICGMGLPPSNAVRDRCVDELQNAQLRENHPEVLIELGLALDRVKV